MNLSRRGFCETGCGALFAVFSARIARASGDPGLAVDRLRSSPGEWNRVSARVYRADVVIVLVGVPLFSRQGCGTAMTLVRESSAADRRTVAIGFAGGADPKRTHGINYSGATEEVAVECGSGLLEAASFGFVTASSSDESFEQARRRVDNNGYGHGSLVVVDESHRASRVHLRRTVVPAPDAPCRFQQMTHQVRSQFADANLTERDISVASADVPATFLYTMLAVARSAEHHSSFRYIHNGKRYQLDCEKSADPHAAGAMVAKNQINAAKSVTRLNGQIHDFETNRTSGFKLWLEDGSDLPVRIEFSPRSYLRITLEFDPEMQSTFDPKEEL